MELKGLVKQAHECALSKGFWEDGRTIPGALLLIHSEVSEAVEAYRDADDFALGEELADVVIRVADLCGHLGYDLEADVRRKMVINQSRPQQHGRKRPL